MKSVTYLPRYCNSNNHHPRTTALHGGLLLCLVVSAAAVVLRDIVENEAWRLWPSNEQS